MSTPIFPTAPLASHDRPSLFELLAEDQLRDLLHPVVKYVLTVRISHLRWGSLTGSTLPTDTRDTSFAYSTTTKSSSPASFYFWRDII